jgi:Transposase
MKKRRYTEEQIIKLLKQHEAEVKTSDLCREHGIMRSAQQPLIFAFSCSTFCSRVALVHPRTAPVPARSSLSLARAPHRLPESSVHVGKHSALRPDAQRSVVVSRVFRTFSLMPNFGRLLGLCCFALAPWGPKQEVRR